MRRLRILVGLALLPCASVAAAQQVIRDEEILASDRPEAWAMNYAMAGSFMTAFGESPALAPGQWSLSAEVGHIPRLSEGQQRVGFGGDKAEDLNKSPVFGRGRVALGLPGGWIAEVGYTPPLSIDGTQPNDLFALALGRRWIDREPWTWSARVFAQHGSASGDITCPAQVVGPFDEQTNPFGCVAPSQDRIALNHYGLDSTIGWGGAWRWHATGGLVRTEPTVQIDALVFAVRDRSHLVARGVLPYMALGVTRELAPGWTVAAEVLHVPLDVRRDPDVGVDNDAFTSLRLRLTWVP